MVVLDLVLKGHWFDRIASGEKMSEYRENKPYWARRLFSHAYSHVRFRRGYTKNTMLFEIKGIGAFRGKNDLDLPEVIEICLGKRVE